MTAQILAAELATLIQDSKRKHSELRTAAEKALQDLKSLPVTSEAQLTADLARRPHFISPFLVACHARNAKFGATGVSCLQRLSVARALPRERLTEVLDALKECVTLSHDVQLKILQALPSLLQNYPVEIRGEALSTILQICSALQNTKNSAVSNTAAATLQQLVIAVFDRVATEDDKALEIPTVAEVPGEGAPVPVRPAAHDAYKVFHDLNLLVTGEKPAFIRFSSIPATSTLELIEAVLSNHGRIVSTHVEQVHILRALLMPVIIRSLSDRLSFPITLRIIRILYLLIRNHLNMMPSECEIALGLLNHMLDPEASPLWKRALCLEVFRGIYSDSRLVLSIYRQFDQQKEKKCIFGDNLAAFVRLATEKPAIIGLGQHSTAPTGGFDGKDGTSDQAVAEAGALAGVIGGPVVENNSPANYVGISTQWSLTKTPCLEQLDKSDPPTLPETYVYSLVLTCITNISESLAKFVLPLTVHHESKSKKKGKPEEAATESEDVEPTSGDRRLSRTQSFRKKTIPVNPLTLIDHPAHSFIQTSSSLVTECWPAVLATCSTFLNAALDSDYYRSLVRSIQKFTQVAGLLGLTTPRDAFLTTLAKAAVPPNLLLANIASPKSPASETPSVFSNAKGLLSVDSLVSQASSIADKNRRPSHDVGVPSLGPRNLLCLRALLNLAIALGPTLQTAWSIVFETLQVADLVMAMSNQQAGSRTPVLSTVPELSTEKLEAETSAVQAAARRLFESTTDYPNESFVELLQALCTLLHAGCTPGSGQRTPTTSSRPQVLHQRRMGSVSGISLGTDSTARDSMFILNKIGELISLNDGRLSQYDPTDSGWTIFVTELVRFTANDRKAATARLLAAEILARTIKDIAEQPIPDEQRNEIHGRILSALSTQVAALYQDDRNDSFGETDIRIHQIALEALNKIIEQCGESLVAGWDSVFSSLASVFTRQDSDPASGDAEPPGEDAQRENGSLPVVVISKQLARSAFGTVQLICSDFLVVVPDTSLSTLLEVLLHFCQQQDDLNMSLTTITFFWNVSDFLRSRSDLSSLPDILDGILEQGTLYQNVQAQSRNGAIPALWLQVLTDLTIITTDQRSELRNSAVQTIQRIFENCADQLSSEAWMLCLRTVLFGMVESNLTTQRDRHSEIHTEDDTSAWNDTTKTVLSSISILITTYMDRVDDSAKLGAAWSDLLDYLQQYFSCGSHALGSSVFTTISKVLGRAQVSRSLGEESLLKTAFVWRAYFEHRVSWRKMRQGNQEAFVAYAEAFKAIYRLTTDSTETDLMDMLSNLEACIIDSDEVAYSSDLDHMTPLQTQVIECLALVRSESKGLPPFLVNMLSRLCTLPYTSTAANPEKRSPTFVALSKASMDQLRIVTTKHIKDESIYTSGAFRIALESLSKPIEEKYIWEQEGRAPTLWQKATTTVLAILKPGLPVVNTLKLKSDESKRVWSQVTLVAHGITRAQISPGTSPITLGKDEAFDMESFVQLRDMITTSLGSSALPDALRRTYTRNLFETSLIHSPLSGEIPDLVSAPLADLYKIRHGQTRDQESTFRVEMAYVCFSELVSLVAVHDSSSERVKLAQAAAPYLILRAALSLRAYISDHPLRGRMPAPESQLRELLFVLRELALLKSEPQAIPDASGVRSKHRKHLHRLYPLLVKASRVARADVEVFDGLVRLTDMVGGEFGLDE
ncbi:hypothetical protein P154DRAFT_104462 [Amniculicola lignicola CBS 123094]|uniref:Endosomal peripheral membrane protein-like protein n=1 Tax=Amniculicola lignicola CBS 123094 TaxID=1392246 RepID=A0A6A5WQL9_9PLEO|nr:hypothetical protein P154DRAFT_104462 [Amniculicola lignicola CBS 123094]